MILVWCKVTFCALLLAANPRIVRAAPLESSFLDLQNEFGRAGTELQHFDQSLQTAGAAVPHTQHSSHHYYPSSDNFDIRSLLPSLDGVSLDHHRFDALQTVDDLDWSQHHNILDPEPAGRELLNVVNQGLGTKASHDTLHSHVALLNPERATNELWNMVQHQPMKEGWPVHDSSIQTSNPYHAFSENTFGVGASPPSPSYEAYVAPTYVVPPQHKPTLQATNPWYASGAPSYQIDPNQATTATDGIRATTSEHGSTPVPMHDGNMLGAASSSSRKVRNVKKVRPDVEAIKNRFDIPTKFDYSVGPTDELDFLVDFWKGGWKGNVAKRAPKHNINKEILDHFQKEAQKLWQKRAGKLKIIRHNGRDYYLTYIPGSKWATDVGVRQSTAIYVWTKHPLDGSIFVFHGAYPTQLSVWKELNRSELPNGDTITNFMDRSTRGRVNQAITYFAQVE